MDCIFCKIVKNEIPSRTVYEDASVLAFLDTNPCSKGHTVVIPKKHYKRIDEMDEEEWFVFMGGLRKTFLKMKKEMGVEEVNIGINDGWNAGQRVKHIHWHIIPRKVGDGGGSMHSIV